jgi:hypothetical protein
VVHLTTFPGVATAARHITSLQSRGRLLTSHLLIAEDTLCQLCVRHWEDTGANACAF